MASQIAWKIARHLSREFITSRRIATVAFKRTGAQIPFFFATGISSVNSDPHPVPSLKAVRSSAELFRGWFCFIEGLYEDS